MTDVTTNDARSDSEAHSEPRWRAARAGWAWILKVAAFLLFLAALANRGNELVYGFKILMALIDFYRGIVHEPLFWLFKHAWPANWPTPNSAMIDGFTIGASVMFWAERRSDRLFDDVWLKRGVVVERRRTDILLSVFLAVVGGGYVAFGLSATHPALLAIALLAVPSLYAYHARAEFKISRRKRRANDEEGSLRYRQYAWSSVRLLALSFLLGLALISLREINARADIALPFVERTQAALTAIAEDIAERGTAYRQRSPEQIRRHIIQHDMIAYIKDTGDSCPCPQNLADDGTQCGDGSAFTRSGGKSPICTAEQVSDEQVAAYRKEHGL